MATNLPPCKFERWKPKRDDHEVFKGGIDAIVERVKQLPVLDERPADEILGYNEQGLFD